MEAVAFLAQYPIRLIQDFDIDRRNNEFVLKCLRLTGDDPGFFQERWVSPEVLPRRNILLDLGNQNWVPFYPFYYRFELSTLPIQRDLLCRPVE
jgi:hypothetical protein